MDKESQKIFEALYDLHDRYDEDPKHMICADGAEQIKKLCEKIDTLKQQVPHWINVKNRLPEEDGNYLAVMDGDLCGQEEPFTSMCGIEKGKWDEPNMVLYWMPLPEPPKEEK